MIAMLTSAEANDDRVAVIIAAAPAVGWPAGSVPTPFAINLRRDATAHISVAADVPDGADANAPSGGPGATRPQRCEIVTVLRFACRSHCLESTIGINV